MLVTHCRCLFVLQIHSMVQKLAQFTDIDAALIVGGLSLTAQAAALRAGPCIAVATPGRVIDHVRNSQGFGLEDLSVLVLDEADRLLEMGFKREVRIQGLGTVLSVQFASPQIKCCCWTRLNSCWRWGSRRNTLGVHDET